MESRLNLRHITLLVAQSGAGPRSRDAFPAALPARAAPGRPQ